MALNLVDIYQVTNLRAMGNPPFDQSTVARSALSLALVSSSPLSLQWLTSNIGGLVTETLLAVQDNNAAGKQKPGY
jgi:hypothetical protein